MSSPNPIVAPFDAVARDYDQVFTRTPLGRRQRAVVHRYLERIMRPEFRVLELNCGTGEDAVWLAQRSAEVLATDISAEMVAVAAAKARQAGVEDRCRARLLAIEALGTPGETIGGQERFDLIFSDFDGINCVHDIAPLPARMARHLVPGGHVVLVYMNPVCAMEIAANLVRGRVGRAFQRFGRAGVGAHIGDGATVHTWFHPIHDVCSAFAPAFHLRHVEAVGLVTPPTLMRDFFGRHERAFRRLYPLEDLLSAVAPFNRMGDHVMLHFQAIE